MIEQCTNYNGRWGIPQPGKGGGNWYYLRGLLWKPLNSFINSYRVIHAAVIALLYVTIELVTQFHKLPLTDLHRPKAQVSYPDSNILL